MSLHRDDVTRLRAEIRARQALALIRDAADRVELLERALAGLSDDQIEAVPRLVAWYRNWFWRADCNTAEAQAEYVDLGRIFKEPRS